MRSTWSCWAISVALSLSLMDRTTAAESINVFAAASLTNALEDIANLYEQGRPIKIVSSFASSSTLARQIEQGAPADLFISADQQWMDYAAAKKTIDTGSRYTLLGNDLVLVAPLAGNTQSVTINKQTDWKSLLKDQRLAVGDPEHVPAGLYAKEALQHLGAWKTVSSMLALGNSVPAALVLVERNEVPYGIVYGSDALASDKVALVGRFPESSHQPVEYPMAIVKDHNKADVTAFYRYLKGPEATAIFKKYGFIPRK